MSSLRRASIFTFDPEKRRASEELDERIIKVMDEAAQQYTLLRLKVSDLEKKAEEKSEALALLHRTEQRISKKLINLSDKEELKSFYHLRENLFSLKDEFDTKDEAGTLPVTFFPELVAWFDGTMHEFFPPQAEEKNGKESFVC